MSLTFKEAEKRYTEIKNLYDSGKIEKQEFKSLLKELIVKDKDGKIWTIGEKSGKWYYLNNGKWVEGIPPKEPIICPNCGRENSPSAKVCAFCGITLEKNIIRCPSCKSVIGENYNYCPFCGFQIGKKDLTRTKSHEIKSLELKSTAVFMGAVFIFIGIILGAYLGVADIFPLKITFPPTLENIRGGMIGGIVFGILGSIAGFLFGFVVGLFSGSFYNLLSFLFKGIVVELKEE